MEKGPSYGNRCRMCLLGSITVAVGAYEPSRIVVSPRRLTLGSKHVQIYATLLAVQKQI